jgi:phosphopantetheinyl transferase (holo-ACP synthase)
MIEVILSAPTRRTDAFWCRGGAHWRRCFAAEELAALDPRGNRAEATMARLLGKCAVSLALRRAGLRQPPVAQELRIAVDAGGRPWVDMPQSCAAWLAANRLGLDISLSHAGDYALAIAVLA